MNKLKVINDDNQIDLLSLSKFFIEKGDDYLEALLKINGYKKLIIDYTSDFFFDRILPYGESKYFHIDIIPDQYWYNYDFCMRAISSNGCGYLLSYVPENLRDYKLCKKAVSDKNTIGLVLCYVPKEFKDYSICEIAVSNHGYSLQFVPKDIINYYNLCEKAVNQNPYSLQFVPKELRDYSLCEKAVSNDKNVIDYISDPMIKQQIKQKFNLQEYIKKELKKLLREYYLKEK